MVKTVRISRGAARIKGLYVFRINGAQTISPCLDGLTDEPGHRNEATRGHRDLRGGAGRYHLSKDITAVILVRRAGDFDAQGLGQHMLREARERGVLLVAGELKSVIAKGEGFTLEAQTPDGPLTIEAGTFINAAGSFARKIASMLDVDLPLECIYQQKIAFEGHLGVVPRDTPFTIDQDAGPLEWPDDVRALLAQDPENRMVGANPARRCAYAARSRGALGAGRQALTRYAGT